MTCFHKQETCFCLNIHETRKGSGYFVIDRDIYQELLQLNFQFN